MLYGSVVANGLIAQLVSSQQAANKNYYKCKVADSSGFRVLKYFGAVLDTS